MAKTKSELRALVQTIRANDCDTLRETLAAQPDLARKAQLVIDAARFAKPRALQLLLDSGADPNAKYRGYRPLHALIQETPHGRANHVSAEQLRCLTLLLEAGADPDLPAAYPPAGALLIAAFTGMVPFVEGLLESGIAADGFAEAALARDEAVACRLDQDPGFATARDRGGLTALQCVAASRMGRNDQRIEGALIALATRLLDAGAEPDAVTKAWSEEVDTAYFAASSHQLGVFRLLLERGADPTAAFVSAVWNAPLEFAELALELGAEIDRARHGGRPLLNDLVRWGQVEKALWLLERGASPEVADGEGWTALHQAASRGNARILRALLAAGGDRERRDQEGRTPLDLARRRGRRTVVDLLS